MNAAKRKAIIETLKSLGRGVWFGLLGLVAVALTAFATSGQLNDVNFVVYGFTINAGTVVLAVVGFIAKGIDTYIHNNAKIKSNGIAPTFLQK